MHRVKAKWDLHMNALCSSELYLRDIAVLADRIKHTSAIDENWMQHRSHASCVGWRNDHTHTHTHTYIYIFGFGNNY